jgi:hypothetical protein
MSLPFCEKRPGVGFLGNMVSALHTATECCTFVSLAVGAWQFSLSPTSGHVLWLPLSLLLDVRCPALAPSQFPGGPWLSTSCLLDVSVSSGKRPSKSLTCILAGFLGPVVCDESLTLELPARQVQPLVPK